MFSHITGYIDFSVHHNICYHCVVLTDFMKHLMVDLVDIFHFAFLFKFVGKESVKEKKSSSDCSCRRRAGKSFRDFRSDLWLLVSISCQI